VADYENNVLWHSNEEVTVYAVGSVPYLLKFADEKLKDNKEIVLPAVTKNGQTLQYASERLRNDKEVVFAAVSNFAPSYAFIGNELKNDKELALMAVKAGGDALNLLSDELKNDFEMVSAAIERNPKAIQFASAELRNNKIMALKAITKDRTVISCLYDDVFNDKDVLMAVMKPERNQIGVNALSNDMPVGLFKAISESGYKIVLISQGLNLLTIDSVKLKYILSCSDNNIPKKNELFHKYVDEDNSGIVQLLLDKDIMTPLKALPEMEYAARSGKLKVLPVLLSFTRGAKMSTAESNENSREKLLRSLKRGSKQAAEKVINEIEEYSGDYEILSLTAEINGKLLMALTGKYACDKAIIKTSFNSYVVKNSDKPLLSFVNKKFIDYDLAYLACKKDYRNWYYIPDEFKSSKVIAVMVLKSTSDIYQKLNEELKSDSEIKRLFENGF